MAWEAGATAGAPDIQMQITIVIQVDRIDGIWRDI